jgi:hypothetical protein
LSSVAATTKASIRLSTTSATIMKRFLSTDCATPGLLATGHIGYGYSIAKKNNGVHTSLVRILSERRTLLRCEDSLPNKIQGAILPYGYRRGQGRVCASLAPDTRQCFGWIVRTTVSSDRSGTLIMNTM